MVVKSEKRREIKSKENLMIREKIILSIMPKAKTRKSDNCGLGRFRSRNQGKLIIQVDILICAR
jgi:hypothetical protein